MNQYFLPEFHEHLQCFDNFVVSIIKYICINYILQAEKQQNGCYNALCPGGYVQVHKSIYPGMVYHKVSVPGGEHQTVHLSVAEVQKALILETIIGSVFSFVCIYL